jgi:hypothetical protein
MQRDIGKAAGDERAFIVGRALGWQMRQAPTSGMTEFGQLMSVCNSVFSWQTQATLQGMRHTHTLDSWKATLGLPPTEFCASYTSFRPSPPRNIVSRRPRKRHIVVPTNHS